MVSAKPECNCDRTAGDRRLSAIHSNAVLFLFRGIRTLLRSSYRFSNTVSLCYLAFLQMSFTPSKKLTGRPEITSRSARVAGVEGEVATDSHYEHFFLQYVSNRNTANDGRVKKLQVLVLRTSGALPQEVGGELREQQRW